MSSSRTFSQADILKFADLSGDHNPIHTGSGSKLLYKYPKPIVHGTHAVPWWHTIARNQPKGSKSTKSNNLSAMDMAGGEWHDEQATIGN